MSKRGRKWLVPVVAILIAVLAAVACAEDRPAGDAAPDDVCAARFELIWEPGEADAVPNENDKAAEGYILRAFGLLGKQTQPRMVSMSGKNGIILAALTEMAQEVAAGERSSTVCQIPITSLSATSFTAEELGVDALIVGGQIADDAAEAFREELLSGIDLSLVISALKANLPYDMYWFGNGFGPSLSYTITSDGETIWIPDVDSVYYEVCLEVSADYSVSGTDNTFVYDTDYGTRVNAAAAKAQEIVNDNAGKTDYLRLKGYKDAICEAVTYDDDAVDPGKPYGDPWQVVSVFDNDPDTNVVCEGYSKAFKYLCDLSGVQSATASLVTGTMSGGTGEGPHMWNLVNMGGVRYLVDVTNCDEGSIGYPDELFMAGYTRTCTGSDGEGNTYWGYVYQANDDEITYLYDSDTIALYAEEELTVSEVPYEAEEPDETITENPILLSIPQTLQAGAPLSVTVKDTAPTDIRRMELTIEQIDGDYSYYCNSYVGGPGYNITFVRYGLDAGSYRITASPDREGYPEEKYLLTVTGERPAAPTVIPSATTVLIGNNIRINVSGDYPEVYGEYRTEENENYVSGYSGTLYGSGTNRYFQLYGSSSPEQRTYRFSVLDGERWSEFSEPVTVTWESLGQTPAQELDVPESLLAGERFVIGNIDLGTEQNDWMHLKLDTSEGEFVKNCIERYYSVKDGAYTVKPYGLDPGTYVLKVSFSKQGYTESEEVSYDIEVTGTRPSAPTCTLSKTSVNQYGQAYAEIKKSGITAAEIDSENFYQQTSTTYLAENGAVRIPLNTSWPGPHSNKYRALIGSQWSSPTDSYTLTVNAVTTYELGKPVLTMGDHFYIGEPVTIRVGKVAKAEYYTLSLVQIDEEGYTNRTVYYDFMLEPDDQGKAVVPTIDCVEPGRYKFAVTAYADGYDPGESEGIIAYGDYNPDASECPEAVLITENPAPNQDVQFRLTGEAAAKEFSVAIILSYEYYGYDYEEFIFNTTVPAENGSGIFTWNYWEVGEGKYKLLAAQRCGDVWSPYSEPVEFTVSGVQQEIPAFGFTSFPEKVVAGEPFTVAWEEAEGAEQYNVSWRFNREDIAFTENLDSDTLETSFTVDPGTRHEYWLHVNVTACARGKKEYEIEREVEIVSSTQPVLAAAQSVVKLGDAISLTASGLEGEQLRISVNGEPDSYLSGGIKNGVRNFTLTPDHAGTYRIRVSSGGPEKRGKPYIPERWSRWSNTVTVLVTDGQTIDYYLPADLTKIESKAFAGLGTIHVWIPDTVEDIADDAFTGTDVTIICSEDSYAARWAERNSVSCETF